MHHFPYITPYANAIFAKEKKQWDFIVLRPVLIVVYFFLRFVMFPFKFLIHRRPLGCEAYLIDKCMALGLKHLARPEAAELFMRHVQIEPLLYRHILQNPRAARAGEEATEAPRKLNGIDGDFAVEDLQAMVQNTMTVGHDLLSYELTDRFDKQVFLDGLQDIRKTRPDDHEQLSKQVLETNRKHSWNFLGPTNVVILIVTAITLFGDLRTTVKALNSFGSDSILLWCLKQIYVDDPTVLIDLDFFMQETSNRGHYNSSAFFSNPSQYLYYHIVFDEVAYDLLRNRPTTASV